MNAWSAANMNETRVNDRPTKFKRVAVLGGLGFIGSRLCRALVKGGYDVRIFDRVGASRARVHDLADHLEIVEGDISIAAEVLATIGDADVVINLVHTTVPGSSMKDPAFDITSNLVAAVGWLQQLGKTRVRRILYVSSGGTVYGVPKYVPINEAHPTDPICSYGITKLAIEKYTALYAGMNSVEYCVLRPSNVYGPEQQLHIGQGVIGILSAKVLRGDRVEVWGTGEAQRDYLYVDDFTNAVMALMSYQGPQTIFNVSSGAGKSVNQILGVIRKHFNSFPEIVHSPERGFDVPVNVLDSSLLRKETAWHPHVDLETGVGHTLEWLKRRP